MYEIKGCCHGNTARRPVRTTNNDERTPFGGGELLLSRGRPTLVQGEALNKPTFFATSFDN